MSNNRCVATSQRQRTAVSVVYGIECSVLMKLKLTDEAAVCHFTTLVSFCGGCVHPLLCGETTLFGAVVSSALYRDMCLTITRVSKPPQWSAATRDGAQGRAPGGAES